MSNGISIIIPAFNRFQMLKNALAGLMIQENFNKNFEVIIVDNGSLEDINQNIRDYKKYIPIKIIKRKITKNYFRPGSARNIGVYYSTFNKIIFLDSDCIPSTNFLSEHWKVLSMTKSKLVTIGHRIFISYHNIYPEDILSKPRYLNNIKHIRSESNYLNIEDRRLSELKELKYHPAPFNCFHSCNIGMNKSDFLKVLMFDLEFDGFWGYEDIELGYRLFLIGLEFIYIPDAFVYHQEGDGLSLKERLKGRKRNFLLACKKIPSFGCFRKELGR